VKLIRLLAVLGLAAPVIALAVAAPADADGEKLPQTLHFTSDVPTGVTVVRDSRYYITVTAESSSGLPVEISIDPGTPACALTGIPPGFVYGNVAPAHAGTCTVFADQAGNDEYAPAERISMTFEIGAEPTYLTAAKASKGALGLTPTTFRASLETGGWFGPGWGLQPFEGEPVSFSVGGKKLCTATTVHVDDGSFFGAATATCKAVIGPAAALKYSTYTATYAGRQDYLPSTATGVLK
jgi:hypothetical protein